MTKTVKALLVSLGALGLIGTGFAAWNITITGETKVERPLSPDTDGTQTLVAQGLDVSEDPTLTFHPNSGAQLAHYVVKAVDTSWYSKVNLLDASEEKVSLKVSFAGTSTNSKWEDRIAIDHAEERIFAPGTWLASSEGYSVDWNFSWKGIGSYANPAEYAQATYATPESQKEYLDAVSADLEGLQFTFTFDLVANTPVGPVNPDPDPVVTTVNASLGETTLDIGGTSNLTVSTNLGTPDSYSIVDKSENYDSVVSFSDGVFTAVAAGTATFKVQVGDVKSEQLSITVNEATPEPTINYGTAENPLDVATAASTIAGLNLAANEWSEQAFVVRGKVKEAPTQASNNATNRVKFHLVSDDGLSEVYCYGVMKQETNPDQNDIVTVTGYVENYGGTVEITGYPTGGYDYPTFSNLVRGTSTITVEADEHATVAVAESGTNGSEQEILIEVGDGYDLDSVKVNNTTVTPVNDEYSFVLHGNTTVVVTTKVHSDDPTINPIEFVFGPTTNSQNAGGYENEWYVTSGSNKLNLQNWNNNNGSWAYVKAGSKNAAYTATMTTESLSDVVTSITITIDALTSSKLNNAYLYVGEEQIDVKNQIATGDVTLSIPEALRAQNIVYQLAFDLGTGGSSNGFITVSKVTINF